MSPHHSLLSLRNLSAAYGAVKVLHDVTLEIFTGEIVTLIGSNGAGKSSLLMALYGKPQTSAGECFFAGERLSDLDPYQIAQRGIALVPEGRRLFPQMTVLENLHLGAAFQKGPPSEAALQRVFTMFPILQERQRQRAGTLSGGEQQMVAIGRGLIAQPKLLLLDEPSLGLAPILVKQIFSALREIKKQGTTLFLVEQNANHALDLADRAYVLCNGRITLSGSGQEVRANPEVKKAYLGEYEA